jgi:hypothetical protein
MRKKLIAGEAGLAGVMGLLAIVSAVWPDWIELAFRWDPDHHNGSAELLIIVGLAFVSIALGAAARWQAVRWRSVAAAAGG